MATVVIHRGLRWLGNVFRMEQKWTPKKGLRRQKETGKV